MYRGKEKKMKKRGRKSEKEKGNNVGADVFVGFRWIVIWTAIGQIWRIRIGKKIPPVYFISPYVVVDLSTRSARVLRFDRL